MSWFEHEGRYQKRKKMFPPATKEDCRKAIAGFTKKNEITKIQTPEEKELYNKYNCRTRNF